MKLPAGELERLEDRQHLFHTRDGGQRLDLEFVLIPDDADDGPQLALTDMGTISQLLNALQDVIDLLRR